MKRMACFVSALLLTTTLSAQTALTPNDFAHRWTVRSVQPVDPAGAALWLELPEAVHAQATSEALLDVAAFNAEGERLTFAPLPGMTVQPSEWREASMFALPSAIESPNGGTANVSMRLSTDGSVVIEASSGAPATKSAANPPREWILDSGKGESPRSGIRLRFAGDAEVSAAFSLESSEDLQSWNTLLSGADVLQLRQQGQVLQRLGAEFSASNARYFRLRQTQGEALPLLGVSFEWQDAERLRFATQRRWKALSCEAGDDAREWVCTMPARLPVDRLDVRLPVNVVAAFDLDRRQSRSSAWQRFGQVTSFELRGMGTAARSEALEWWGGADGDIRLRSRTALSEAPEVRVGWRPAAWLLLTRGSEPYVVVAGQGSLRDPHPPVDAMLQQIRLRQSASWTPPRAELVDGGALAGESARRTDSPQDRRNMWLWAVLGLGVFVVGFMVFRLLREPKSPS